MVKLFCEVTHGKVTARSSRHHFSRCTIDACAATTTAPHPWLGRADFGSSSSGLTSTGLGSEPSWPSGPRRRVGAQPWLAPTAAPAPLALPAPHRRSGPWPGAWGATRRPWRGSDRVGATGRRGRVRGTSRASADRPRDRGRLVPSHEGRRETASVPEGACRKWRLPEGGRPWPPWYSRSLSTAFPAGGGSPKTAPGACARPGCSWS